MRWTWLNGISPVVQSWSCVDDRRDPPASAADEVFVTYDGQSVYPLREPDVVKVCRAPHALRLARAPQRSYFEVLREKLKWGER